MEKQNADPLRLYQRVGGSAGESIEIAARGGKFLSKDDLRQRAKIGQTVIDKLSELKLLDWYGRE